VSGYLLDTNILIAFANDSVGRLPPRIRRLLAAPGAALAISVVSPWEISIKHGAGKLLLEIPLARIPGLFPELGFTLLPMTIDHALEVAQPEPATNDPFDRLLLAVCACEGLKLVTTDTKLAGHRLVY
jgi:PIN domain nuclease of toxin-antitoxin system